MTNQNQPFDLNQSPSQSYYPTLSKDRKNNSIQDLNYSNQCSFFNRSSPLPLKFYYSPNKFYSPHNIQIKQGNLFDQIPLAELYRNPSAQLQQPEFKDKLDFSNVQSELKVPNFNQKRKFQELTATKTKVGSAFWHQKKISKPRDKGLRVLSSRALQILGQAQSATYKEVANKLIYQLEQQNEIDTDGRDQSNIKRRVYDALNVMIALGIMKKEGRKIVVEKNKKKQKYTSHDDFQMTIQQLQKEQHNLGYKKKRYEELKLKHTNISNLVSRNKQIQISQQQIIKFPFIGTIVQDFNENIMVNQQIISISSNKRLKLFGDVDSLNFIRIENKQ